MSAYADITLLVERLHRRYLDVIRAELSRIGIEEVNPVQALLLMNVQDNQVSIRELVDRGYYVGSNVTYNVRQLVDHGYLEQNRATHDKRSVKIKASAKGLALCGRLMEMDARHAEGLDKAGWANGETERTRDMLKALERVWLDTIHYGVT